jgi:TonB family protein
VAATPVPARAHLAPALVPRAQSAPTCRVDVIAVTRDDALLEEVGRELDGETGIRLADSVDAAREHVDAAHAQVFLLDARESADPGSAADRLQSFSDSGVVVVFAPASQSPDIAHAIRRSAAFAVLPIPVETGKTAAVLSGAREEALSRAVVSAPKASAQPAAQQVVASQPAEPVPWLEPVTTAPPARPRTPGWLVPGTVGLVVVGISVTWFLLDQAGQDTLTKPGAAAVAPRPAPVAASPVPDRIERGSIEDLLDKAATAFLERRYVEPETDSALLYYRSVLAQAPGNGEAREGLDRVAAVLDERLQSALAERRFDDAATTVAQFARVRPGDPKVQSAAISIVEGRIAAALDAGKTDRASALVRQAAQAGTLPAERTTYWRDEITRRQGGTRVNQRAQTASAQRQTVEVERWLAQARAVGVTTATALAAVPTASTRVDATPAPPSLSEPERLARLVQQRISEGRLVDPTEDSAVHYYGSLRTKDPTGAATADQARALSSQLVEGAGSALAGGEFEMAQRYLDAARGLGLEPTRVEGLERRLAAARQPLPVPLQSPSLERTYYVAPAYPKVALEKGLRGEVRVRIAVDADGRVQGAEIVSSTPAGVFDNSVLAAVSRWRFKAPRVEGRAVEASTVISVVFEPVDGARQ